MAKKNKKKAARKKATGEKPPKKPAKNKTRKRDPLNQLPSDPLWRLHEKKLAIMKENPIMPCSAISRDKNGALYCYTKADKVYQIYREAGIKRGLTIRRVKSTTEDAYTVGEKGERTPCVRCQGTWEICDTESGQKETFEGSGDGDNYIWSNNSAQTIAKKQALLDYYEVAWPQPECFSEVIRTELKELPYDDYLKVMKQIQPPEHAYKLLTTKGAVEEMTEYFAEKLKK